MNQGLDIADKLLDQHFFSIPQFSQLKTKIPASLRPAHLALAILFLIAGVLISLLGQSGLCYAGCVIYPAYKSVLAIESPDRADDTQWLTYWVVFSVVGFVETVSDLLLDWIPFYFFVKCGFFYYLMNPRLKGATCLYKILLQPIAQKHLGRSSIPAHAE